MNHEPKKECFKTSVGGQALMEGIMMRGPEHICCAVRKPDGTIETKIDDTPKHGIWAKIPLVRGAISMIESMTVGLPLYDVLAQVSMGDEYDAEEEESAFEKWVGDHLGKKAEDILMAGAAGAGRSVGDFAVHRSADGAGGRPRQGGHPDPLAESHPRGGAESGHLPQLHGGHLQDEGDPPRFRVSRRRAQDHRLLRGRRRADRGECPQVHPFPPPLRHQLPHSGGHRQRFPL